MTMHFDPKAMIERPDGSIIPFEKLEPAKQVEHELVTMLGKEAELISAGLAEFKHRAISELIAARVMMMEDHGVKKGGADGNLTLRSACGTFMVKMSVSKHITFGPELEAARELIFEFLEDELKKGGSEVIHEIVKKVFDISGRGRIDTSGILGLREHRFEDERWERAMKAIEAAICRDSSTTYVNFYRVDPTAKKRSEGETRIPLNLSEV